MRRARVVQCCRAAGVLMGSAMTAEIIEEVDDDWLSVPEATVAPSPQFEDPAPPPDSSTFHFVDPDRKAPPYAPAATRAVGSTLTSSPSSRPSPRCPRCGFPRRG
jgi:hypothetical protein